MNIKLQTVYAGFHPETGSPLTLRPGDVIDFPEAKARELVKAGYAEAVDPPSKVKDEVTDGAEGGKPAGKKPARS